MYDKHHNCWTNQIIPLLKKENIYFSNYKNLNIKEKLWTEKYFAKHINPILTPIAIDKSHPFPALLNKALYILVSFNKRKHSGNKIAIIPVPRILKRILKIDNSRKEDKSIYVFLADIIREFSYKIFPKHSINETFLFRITRNSELYINEEEVENLLSQVKSELVNREKGSVVRLEISKGCKPEIINELIHLMDIKSDFVYEINGAFNPLVLMDVYNLIDRPDLKFKIFQPSYHFKNIKNFNIFNYISQKDLLLHHPYDSFQTFTDFIVKAANDPKVFAIKQTIYRTSEDSPIIDALINASINGKHVIVIVEIKARFDEANNIHWAKKLEDAGAHVIYGVPNYKTHCKACLIIRREKNRFKRYAHLGTGNYNPNTSITYTDFGLFTSKNKITKDVAKLFNTLTGFSDSVTFNNLIVAPFNLHNRIQYLIKNESKNAIKGLKSRIIIKVNSLTDKTTIDNLYKASQSGVKIDLIIRGICNLVPNIKGMSENIRVRSIIGRHLEHSRIFYFENKNKNEPLIFLGSADVMQRNFFKRIECLFPIEDLSIKNRIKKILEIYLRDSKYSRYLNNKGKYYSRILDKSLLTGSHDIFMEQSKITNY